MTAHVRLVRGPAGSGKTSLLLDEYRRRVRRAPGSALWLGPTPRAVDAVRPLLPGHGGAAVGVRLSTFAEFFHTLVRHHDPAARPLSEVQRRLLLDDVVRELAGQGRLAHFGRVLDTRGFADGLAALLAELRRCGVTPDAFEAGAGEGERQLAAVHARYLAELESGGYDDAEGRAARAAVLLRDGLPPPFADVRAVFLDGLADFTPAEWDALTRLAASVEELWLTLLDEDGDERAELFAGPRATRERLLRAFPAAVVGERPSAPLSPKGRGEKDKTPSLKVPPPASPTSNASSSARCAA